MEVCSISRRSDFHGTVAVQRKGGPTEVAVMVLEVAVGLDRCVRLWSLAPDRA